jgi:uncharacterized protein (TIGR02246 family)
MTTLRVVVFLMVSAVASGCGTGSQHMLTSEERGAVADTVGRLFDQVREATNALDLDRLLGLYRHSDDLMYIAQGRVTRSYDAYEQIVHAQFDPVAEANLQWLHTSIDVLTRDVAIATAAFQFTAVLPDGNMASSTGTYTAVYSLRDGEWKIDYSIHTFPPTG